MNFLGNLIPSLRADEDTRSPEEIEAQEKQDRIDYHRSQVRNGPVSYKTPTNGQLRRHKARGIKSRMKKTRRRQISAFFASQYEAGLLRSHLQSVGLVAYATRGYRPSPNQVYHSAIWLVKRFADAEGSQVEVTEEVVRDAFQSALSRWASLVGLNDVRLPEDYVLPVRTAA